MENKHFEQITKEKSTTFYKATRLFPTQVRDEVFALYAFLRTADDTVDEPRNKNELQDFKNKVFATIESDTASDNEMINAFNELYKKYKFEKEWIQSMFRSFEYDQKESVIFHTYKELEEYIYGVADVVGYMMASIMRLPKELYYYAGLLGRAMQLVNILRDVQEDLHINRVYIPQEDLTIHKINTIAEYNQSTKNELDALIHYELDRINKIFDEAEIGLNKLPTHYKKPISIASDIYKKLAQKMYANPKDIWDRKIKITKQEVTFIVLKNYLK